MKLTTYELRSKNILSEYLIYLSVLKNKKTLDEGLEFQLRDSRNRFFGRVGEVESSVEKFRFDLVEGFVVGLRVFGSGGGGDENSTQSILKRTVLIDSLGV